MHPQERHARFDLKVISVAVLLMVTFYCIFFFTIGPMRARSAFAFMSILGIMGFDGRFYRKKDGERVVMDERDIEIKRKGMIAGWGVAWLYWGLACMGPWFYLTTKHGFSDIDALGISVFYLPLAYMTAMMVHIAASSIAILVMYQRGIVDHEG